MNKITGKRLNFLQVLGKIKETPQYLQLQKDVQIKWFKNMYVDNYWWYFIKLDGICMTTSHYKTEKLQYNTGQ